VHEYQCQAILSRFHVKVPKSYPATTMGEAVAAAKKIGVSVKHDVSEL
jgi:succinyl-CoA synthetase beta subunit